MKKITLLTSILALAACSGGHSGGTSGIGATNGLESAARSNANVTSMYTTIEINDAGANVSVAGGKNRRATTLANGNTIYDLEDVNFKYGDKGVGVVELDVNDDKKIVNFIFHDVEGDGSTTFERQGNTNNFAGVAEFNDENQNAVLTYNSLGKDMGLRYSDFGDFAVDIQKGWKPVFIGGYDVRQIKTENINTDETPFTGRATGSVVTEVRNTDDKTTSKSIELDGAAQLAFADGNSTLTAQFDNWYDIKYTSADNQIEFTTDTPVADDYRLHSDTTGNGNITIDAKTVDIRYFGDENTPDEAVGLIHAKDKYEQEGGYKREVMMNVAFGAQK